MSEMTILEGVKIIAERLENFPDEFNKWKHFVQWSVLDKESPLEDHEKAYLSDAYKKAERMQYNADVLKQIQDEPKLKYKTEGRYATLWNDPMTAFGSPQIKAEGQAIGYELERPITDGDTTYMASAYDIRGARQAGLPLGDYLAMKHKK